MNIDFWRDLLGVDLIIGTGRGLDGVDSMAGGWVGFPPRWESICGVVDVVLDVRLRQDKSGFTPDGQLRLCWVWQRIFACGHHHCHNF